MGSEGPAAHTQQKQERMDHSFLAKINPSNPPLPPGSQYVLLRCSAKIWERLKKKSQNLIFLQAFGSPNNFNIPISELTVHVLLLRVRSRAYIDLPQVDLLASGASLFGREAASAYMASAKFNLILRSLLTTFLSNLIRKLARNETFHLFLQTWNVPLITEQNLARFCSPATISARNWRFLTGIWKSWNPESGIRNRNLNWDRGKLGSTETSSRYPCGNKIQDGVLWYHCVEKFFAQWSWYQRYTHIRKVTCKKKRT